MLFASIYDPNGWAVLGGAVVMIAVVWYFVNRELDELKRTIADQKHEIEKARLEVSQIYQSKAQAEKSSVDKKLYGS
jgi:hypothetical protein